MQTYTDVQFGLGWTISELEDDVIQRVARCLKAGLDHTVDMEIARVYPK